MAISLEELRQQRHQIQAHLDWLDAKIADEKQIVACPTREAEAQQRLLAGRPEHEVHQPEPRTESSADTKAENPTDARNRLRSKSDIDQERAAHNPEETQVSPSAEPPDSDTEAPQFKSKTAEEVARAKIGCVVVFVLATALFLFLLFGLPYLL